MPTHEEQLILNEMHLKNEAMQRQLADLKRQNAARHQQLRSDNLDKALIAAMADADIPRRFLPMIRPLIEQARHDDGTPVLDFDAAHQPVYHSRHGYPKTLAEGFVEHLEANPTIAQTFGPPAEKARQEAEARAAAEGRGKVTSMAELAGQLFGGVVGATQGGPPPKPAPKSTEQTSMDEVMARINPFHLG